MTIKISIELSDDHAWAFAQLVKRLASRNLIDLGLVTGDDEAGADRAVLLLRDELREKGFAPR